MRSSTRVAAAIAIAIGALTAASCTVDVDRNPETAASDTTIPTGGTDSNRGTGSATDSGTGRGTDDGTDPGTGTGTDGPGPDSTTSTTSPTSTSSTTTSTTTTATTVLPPAPTELVAAPVLAQVSPLEVGILLTGPTARLTSQGAPRAGQRIAFYGTNRDKPICTGTTDAAGIATCTTPTMTTDLVQALKYRAVFTKTAQLDGISATGPILK
jgi:hypothetical protein